MAARADAARRPRAERALGVGVLHGDAHVLVSVYAVDVEHLRDGAGRRSSRADAENGVELVHLQRAEALPGGKDHFGFFDGIAQPAVAGAGVLAAPGRRPAGRRGRLARGGDRRGAARATPTRTARCRSRRSRRSTATGRSSSTASSRWTRRRSGATSATAELPGRRRSCWRRRSSAAGRTARRSPLSPDGPDAAIAGDSQRINDFGYADDPTACKCPLGAHIRRANPRDAPGFFDGRLSNRHRIVRRGRAYGAPLRAGRTRGRRRRPRPGLRLLPGRHLAPVRDHPGALDRRRRPVRPRPRQGLPGRRAARHGGQDDDPRPPAVLPQAAAALRHPARRRLPLPAVDDRATRARPERVRRGRRAPSCGRARRRWRSSPGRGARARVRGTAR